eukprot:CAMPEP_0184651670 /NCGR_PEP_ID=MMETSP0308-20130426/9323_1 /TAXON_ID=38269 /ORGANISM="Gloeochaete witrockiana, Strain SAG 46.84" /LENGTH=101 /DNA_ID=CAMNT_0027086063 /DNA_START=145 /DNA_END=450 /DNA_ORIENTATION=-
MDLCESLLPFLPLSPEALESDARFSQLVQQFGSLHHEPSGRRASFLPVRNKSGVVSGVWRGCNGSYFVLRNDLQSVWPRCEVTGQSLADWMNVLHVGQIPA